MGTFDILQYSIIYSKGISIFVNCGTISLRHHSIDSAEWYENEGECGAAIKSFLEQHNDVKRSDIFFTTKLRENVSYEATRTSIKKSLKDSGLDYIDMYLLHAPYGGQKIREACYKAILDAVDDGEVKVAGVSNFGVSSLLLSAPFPLFLI